MSTNNIRDRLNEVMEDVGLKRYIQCPCGGVMYDWHSHASNCIIIKNKEGVDYAKRKADEDSKSNIKGRILFRKLRRANLRSGKRNIRTQESL
jgi:hypothetical protein